MSNAFPPKSILVPTDFSETANSALAYGKKLANLFNVPLHVLHVLQDPLIYVPPADGYAMQPNYRKEAEKDARRQLDERLAGIEGEHPQYQLVVQWGAPFVEIIRYAKSHDIDLIVMGTHGRGAIAHLLIGSVAENVVRKSPCAVLTVRASEHAFAMP
ncbi:MAG: universal stress protein [Gemmataceae bacterium]